MKHLTKYGANDFFMKQAEKYPELYIARITSQYKALYRIEAEEYRGLAEVSGRFRYESMCPSDFPAVGDFVMVDRNSANSGNAVIHYVLPRKSVFERTAAGTKNQTQVIAANIDLVFICMSLNNDYNKSRLERYLSIAWSSGATPVIVLTKSDLCTNLPAILAEIAVSAVGTDILVTSSREPDTYDSLLPYLKQGLTAAFIGSSGVGKSTLINHLLGNEIMETSDIRQDDKGRHTTTRRELLLLPQGGMVIDTPGMRELGAETVDLSKSFTDIEELTENCRFYDCTHTAEPGCAILEAIESGNLERRRFENYLKLQREARYDGLSSKQIETEKINSMFGSMKDMKNFKKHLKQKKKQR